MNLQKDITSFKIMRNLKNKIANDEAIKISYNVKKIFDIYHDIETKKMNGYDMYNMMKALQYQIQLDYNNKSNKKSREKHFENMGGLDEYLKLKNKLLDAGVNIHELN